jgi:hypothetical protein
MVSGWPATASAFVDVLLDAYAAMMTRPEPEVTATVREVTGSSARGFAQWAADHADDIRLPP